MNYYEVIICGIDPVSRDLLMADLADQGFESFVETDEGFKAYIREADYREEVLSLMRDLNGRPLETAIRMIPEENWNALWEKQFEAVVIEDFCCIRAPFHPKPGDVKFDLMIEPKMSFGTGHHETTSMMVSLMKDMDFINKSVLDMGCGTGILAILAVKMGAGAVSAVDIDEWAYQNTLENCERNKTGSVRVIQGGAEVLGKELKLPFDIILANINRNILLADMAAYAGVLKKGGSLVLSGFYTADMSMILESAGQFSLYPLRSMELNDWTAQVLIKK